MHTTLDPGAPIGTLFDQPDPQKDVEVNKLPKFKTLKGRISYNTLKAITVRPHKLMHMSAVQVEVLPLLPQIAEPYSVDLPADGSQCPVETEYHEMLFRLETERSDKELYQIIVQSRPVQMISY